MCLCFRWQKYTIFLLLLIVEDYFHCFCPVVPPNHFSILTVCDFHGGKANTFGADRPYAARGPHARITPPHCGLRPCAGLLRWYPSGIHSIIGKVMFNADLGEVIFPQHLISAA